MSWSEISDIEVPETLDCGRTIEELSESIRKVAAQGGIIHDLWQSSRGIFCIVVTGRDESEDI